MSSCLHYVEGKVEVSDGAKPSTFYLEYAKKEIGAV